MRKIKSAAAILLSLVLTLSLTACGEIQKAETAVNGMFEAVKSLNFEEAGKYISDSGIEELADAPDEATEMFVEKVCGNMSHEIVSSEKADDGSVLVKTNITSIDMKPVLENFLVKAVEYTFSTGSLGTQMTDEESQAKMQEILAECISAPDLATVTNEVDIKVAPDDNGEWKIEGDDALASAMLGNLTESLENIDEALG